VNVVRGAVVDAWVGGKDRLGRRVAATVHTEMFASELLNASVMVSINGTQVNVRYLEQERGGALMSTIWTS
jgi:hypothetical protein